MLILQKYQGELIMSKIGYRYRTPIPMIFWKNGMLDPSKKIYLKRLAYLSWAFWKCHYDCVEFSANRAVGALESGLTEDEWRTQEEYFISEGFLKKQSNEIQKRENRYQWDIEKIFDEKIISIEKIPNQKPTQTIENQSIRSESKENSPIQTKKSPTESPTESPIKSPSILREEIKKNPQPNPQPNPQQNPPVYINDNKAINIPLSKSDNVAKPRACEKLPLSSKRKITAFFDPRTYKLRNGEPLSLRMQRALYKYPLSKEERLLPNVQFYEQWVDSGKPIKRSHEAFLQHCISEDLAMKNENAGRNHLWAKFIKERHEAHGIEILEKVIKLRKSGHEEPESVPKELPIRTFEDILDNYINNYYPEIACAK